MHRAATLLKCDAINISGLVHRAVIIAIGDSRCVFSSQMAAVINCSSHINERKCQHLVYFGFESFNKSHIEMLEQTIRHIVKYFSC